MKKVAALVSLLVVLSLALAGGASALENSWLFNIKADDPDGLNGQTMVIRVYSSSKDPLPSDVVPLSDARDVRWTALQSSQMGIGGVFPIDTAGTQALWQRDVKGPLMPWDEAYHDTSFPPYYHKKVWNLRVAGCGAATSSTIRLQFTTIGPQAGVSVLPPATLTHPTYGPLAAEYYLKMVDNRGKVGAPGNGTIWSIPIPTVDSGISYFTLTLPAFNISVAMSAAKMIDEGYVMEFYQTAAVPETSSLMTLSAGLLALAGFARRRRSGR